MTGVASARRTAAAVGLGVVVAVLVALVTRTPAVGVVPGALAAVVPTLVAAHRRAERRRAVTDAWPDVRKGQLATLLEWVPGRVLELLAAEARPVAAASAPATPDAEATPR